MDRGAPEILFKNVPGQNSFPDLPLTTRGNQGQLPCYSRCTQISFQACGHRGTQRNGVSSINTEQEELGLELQKLAKRAFPTVNGKDFDRLLKGRLFQALLPRWQRKLGAPKPDESFEELFARARTMERREEQYTAVSSGRTEPRNRNVNAGRPQTQPAREGSERSPTAPTEPRGQGQGIQCHACHRFGHIAKFCRNRQRRGAGAEAPGRPQESNSHVVTSVTQFSSAELEELCKRRLEGEQELLDAHLKSNVQVVTGAVGPSYWLELSVDGVVVSAMVDTGSQSTIVSRNFLHKVCKHLHGEGKPVPKLESPSTQLRGKGGHPIDVVAQVNLTFSLDGKSIVTPVFVQPDSEQECLLGSNVIGAIGITVKRANGETVNVSVGNNPEAAHVNLLQATSIPGMKGCYARAQIGTESCRGQELLFEPAHDELEPLGVSAIESLISVNSDGVAVIPVQNFQGVCAHLDSGTRIGTVRKCDLSDIEVTPSKIAGCPEVACAHVKAFSGSEPRRHEKLLEELNLPKCKLNADELDQLKTVLFEYSDVFDSELGKTSVVRHSIDTGDHKPIKQLPYRTPIIRRETIRKMVDEMCKQGIVQPSRSPWASPVVLVPKKDGSLRFCVDFRNHSERCLSLT